MIDEDHDLYDIATKRLANWDGSTVSLEEVAEMFGIDLGDDDDDE